MSDRYLEFTQSSFGRTLSGLLGLPQPPSSGEQSKVIR